VFDTPRGEYAVQSKFVKPAWVKPDWPSLKKASLFQNMMDRVEMGMLGDYALGSGMDTSFMDPVYEASWKEYHAWLHSGG